MKKIPCKQSVHIRKAIPADLNGIYELVGALEHCTFEPKIFAQIFEENLNNPNCLYWVAATEQQTVGFISFHIQNLLHHCGPVGEIQEFYIDKAFRNKGMGRCLMNEVLAYAKAAAIKSIEVTSNKRRIENIRVYESLGFTLTHNKFTIANHS